MVHAVRAPYMHPPTRTSLILHALKWIRAHVWSQVRPLLHSPLARTADQRQRSHDQGNKVVEVVSSCSPEHKCSQALRRHLPAALILTDGHEARSASLSKALNLSKGNGRIIYDQVRCARCENIIPISVITSKASRMRIGSDTSRSSFWQQITRMHARFYPE